MEYLEYTVVMSTKCIYSEQEMMVEKKIALWLVSVGFESKLNNTGGDKTSCRILVSICSKQVFF